jgi:hypothetical protein
MTLKTMTIRSFHSSDSVLFVVGSADSATESAESAFSGYLVTDPVANKGHKDCD